MQKIPKGIISLFWSLASLSVFLLLWQGIAMWISWRAEGVFPYPLESLESFIKMLKGKAMYGVPLWEHLMHSLWRWTLGFVIASVVGALAGVLLSSHMVLRKLFEPWFQVVQMIPGLAWVPVALLLFGIGEAGTVFMVTMVAIGPIALAVRSGMQSVPREWVESARILQCNSWQMILFVRIPASIPVILQGMRAALGNAWRVLIAAEMIVGTGIGLGYIISQSRWTLRFAESFAVIAIIAAIGLWIDRILFARLEKKWLRRMGDLENV